MALFYQYKTFAHSHQLTFHIKKEKQKLSNKATYNKTRVQVKNSKNKTKNPNLTTNTIHIAADIKTVAA